MLTPIMLKLICVFMRVATFNHKAVQRKASRNYTPEMDIKSPQQMISTFFLSQFLSIFPDFQGQVPAFTSCFNLLGVRALGLAMWPLGRPTPSAAAAFPMRASGSHGLMVCRVGEKPSGKQLDQLENLVKSLMEILEIAILNVGWFEKLPSVTWGSRLGLVAVLSHDRLKMV